MGLGPEMIYFIGLYVINEVHQLARVRKVSIMEEKLCVWVMGIDVNVIDSMGVKGTGPPYEAMDLIAL